jgi:cell division protease FtsH
VGHRHRGASEALNDFLLALDGGLPRHEGVVTVATTNDLHAIDQAAKRAARFDVVVSVGLPEARERAAILRRYLTGIEHSVKVERVAAETNGASGADLRELVSEAVIRAGDPEVTTRILLELARARFAPRPSGLYL